MGQPDFETGCRLRYRQGRCTEAAVYGKGTPQTTILNRGLWGFYDDMEGFPHDLDRAKSLMEEAGYKDGGIDTTLSFATGAPYEQIATVIQANLQDIGIKVTLVPLETATLKETCVEGNQELFLWRWNEDTKCDYVYRDLFYTDSWFQLSPLFRFPRR